MDPTNLNTSPGGQESERDYVAEFISAYGSDKFPPGFNTLPPPEKQEWAKGEMERILTEQARVTEEPSKEEKKGNELVESALPALKRLELYRGDRSDVRDPSFSALLNGEKIPIYISSLAALNAIGLDEGLTSWLNGKLVTLVGVPGVSFGNNELKIGPGVTKEEILSFVQGEAAKAKEVIEQNPVIPAETPETPASPNNPPEQEEPKPITADDIVEPHPNTAEDLSGFINRKHIQSEVKDLGSSISALDKNGKIIHEGDMVEWEEGGITRRGKASKFSEMSKSVFVENENGATGILLKNVKLAEIPQLEQEQQTKPEQIPIVDQSTIPPEDLLAEFSKKQSKESEPAPAPAPEPEPEPEPEKEIEINLDKKLDSDLFDAREKYAKAQVEANKKENRANLEKQRELEEARAEYEEKRKILEKEIKEKTQEKATKEGIPQEEIDRDTNSFLFKKLVVEEHDAFIRELRYARKETWKDKAMEAAKNLLSTKTIEWYLGLSRKQRMALSFGIGGIAGLALVAGPGMVGAITYLGWRAARVGLSGTAGAVAGEWANKKWSAEELKAAEEKETEDLKNDTNLSLEEKSKGFADIQQRYKKERIKMAAKKIGTTIIAGAGTGLLTGLAEHAVMGVGGATRTALESKGKGPNVIEHNKVKMSERLQVPKPKVSEPVIPKPSPMETPRPEPGQFKVSIPESVKPIRPEINPEINPEQQFKVIVEKPDEVAGPKVAEAEVPDSTEKIFSDPSVLRHKAVAGNSTWKLLEKTLEHNDKFKAMNEAQKTFVVSTLANELMEDPSSYGLHENGDLLVGDKVDFTELFKDVKGTNAILDKAEHLSDGQVKSIMENNEKIADWVEKHPNELLTNEKVSEILATKSGVEISEPPVLPNIKPSEVVVPEAIGHIEPAPEFPTEIQTVPKPEGLQFDLPAGEAGNGEAIVAGGAGITGAAALSTLGGERKNQLYKEIEEARNRLSQLETSTGTSQTINNVMPINSRMERTYYSDTQEASIVEGAYRSEVNSIYDSRGLLKKTSGIDSSEWAFMNKLPAEEVLQYARKDSSQSKLSIDTNVLDKSGKHQKFISRMIELLEEAGDGFRPYKNEKVGDFFKRLGGFIMKKRTLSETSQLKKAA